MPKKKQFSFFNINKGGNMNYLETAKKWLWSILDLGLVIVALAVVLQVLFGASVPFVGGDVVANVIQLVTALGSQGLVGLVAVGVLFWVFNRKV
tara:strand:+ start:837 stop:1118 length:282 start_codon:yes stop_codon:yes gene_type:complete